MTRIKLKVNKGGKWLAELELAARNNAKTIALQDTSHTEFIKPGSGERQVHARSQTLPGEYL